MEDIEMDALKIVVMALAVIGLTTQTAFADKDGKAHGSKPMAQQVQGGGPMGGGQMTGRDDSDAMDSESREQTRDMEEEENRSREGMSDQGKQVSSEMRERKDERKQIMEETKTQGKKEEPEKGKKSWWKFWE